MDFKHFGTEILKLQTSSEKNLERKLQFLLL